MSFSITISLGKVLLRCLGPSTITLVLSKFSNRKLQLIQVFMSLRQAWRLLNLLVSFGFKDKYNWYHRHDSENYYYAF